jgi:hypothetical protein
LGFNPELNFSTGVRAVNIFMPKSDRGWEGPFLPTPRHRDEVEITSGEFSSRIAKGSRPPRCFATHNLRYKV